MQVTTIKQHKYAGKKRNVGDSYDMASKKDLKVARALGWVKPAEENNEGQLFSQSQSTQTVPPKKNYFAQHLQNPFPHR